VKDDLLSQQKQRKCDVLNPVGLFLVTLFEENLFVFFFGERLQQGLRICPLWIDYVVPLSRRLIGTSEVIYR
jgi:hypothetical protein